MIEEHLTSEQALKGFSHCLGRWKLSVPPLLPHGLECAELQGDRNDYLCHHNLHVTKRADAAAQQVQKIPRWVISSHGSVLLPGTLSDGEIRACQ